VPFFYFFCFCRFNKEKARKEIVTSPQRGKNWTIGTPIRYLEFMTDLTNVLLRAKKVGHQRHCLDF
jgi:hypothetical protein